MILKSPEDKSNVSATAGLNLIDNQKKRNYRKRKSSDSKTRLSDGEIEDSDEEINRVNLDDIRMAKKHKQEENVDADSDFSIDESSDEEPDKKTEKQSKYETKNKEVDIRANSSEKDKIKSSKQKNPESKETKDDTIEPKHKIDIWKKRTVGPVFEEALKRYYERKSVRGC